jgi:carbon-monoxide dehydrogenase small subunit
MQQTISFSLNGQPVRVTAEESRALLWVLREDLGLTGTKFGCGLSLCGACTVLVDGQAVASCSTPVGEVMGKEVLTIEGLSREGRLHPIQDAFVKHNAFQCGFCTPGMIMRAYALLLKSPRISEAEIIQEMDGNLCRCGCHPRIVQAIEEASLSNTGAGR